MKFYIQISQIFQSATRLQIQQRKVNIYSFKIGQS